MRILVDQFLAAAGCPAPKGLDQPQACPHCRTPGALVATLNHVTNSTVFHCSACRFHGDAVQFIASLHKESITDALAKFAPGGIFAHTLLQGYSQAQLQEYTKQYHSQDYIRQYVTQMHENLASKSGTAFAQTVPIFRGGKPTFPKAMGFVTDQNIPPELNRLSTATYRRNRYFSFTYTYNHDIVGVAVRALRDINAVNYFNLLPDDLGVFMEDVLRADHQTIFLAPDDLCAAALYTKAQQQSTIPMQVIAARGLPLPATFKHVRQINLLSFRDRPLLLHTALTYLTARELVEFNPSPDCFVIHLETPLERILPEQIKNAETKHYRLITWVAYQLVHRYRIHGEAAVLDILAKHSIAPALQGLMQNALRSINAPEELIKLLENAQLDLSDERRLANGKRVVRTINGFLGRDGATAFPLSDTMFKIDECVVTRAGDIRYNITIISQKSNRGPLKLTLAQQDFKNEEKLKEAIQRGFINRGEHLSIAFYNSPGYSWSEIRDAFSDNLAVRHEIEHLGIDDNGKLHFPNCVIDLMQDSMHEQQPLITFEEETVRCYQAIVPREVSQFIGVPLLWTTNTPEHMALAAGLSHVLGQVLTGVLCKKQNLNYFPQHLVYVDISPQTWIPCFKQLATIFSGTEYVPHLQHHRPVAYMEKLKDLHCLPYICQFPVLPMQGARNLIQQSPVSLLTLSENEQGEYISPEENVWFLALEQMNPRLPGLLDNDLLALLQQEFSSLLAYFLGFAQTRTKHHWLTTTNPIVQVFDWVAESLRIDDKTSNGVANMCKKYYAAYSYHTARSFLYELKRMFFAGGAPYTPQKLLRGSERPKETFAVFEDRKHHMVYVHQHVADVINQQNKKLHFNVDTLTKELTEAGYLAEITTEPYWILHEEVWQSHVANQIRILPVAELKEAQA